MLRILLSLVVLFTLVLATSEKKATHPPPHSDVVMLTDANFDELTSQTSADVATPDWFIEL